MTQYKYSTQMEGARAVGRDLSISIKHAMEVCKLIRGKELSLAKKLLNEVSEMKRAVPYTTHTYDLGHKPGMAAGRYPWKTAVAILKILESAEVNAQFKGMNTSQLKVAHISAQKAAEPYHAGRHRGQTMRRAHIEIILGTSSGDKK